MSICCLEAGHPSRLNTSYYKFDQGVVTLNNTTLLTFLVCVQGGTVDGCYHKQNVNNCERLHLVAASSKRKCQSRKLKLACFEMMQWNWKPGRPRVGCSVPPTPTPTADCSMRKRAQSLLNTNTNYFLWELQTLNSDVDYCNCDRNQHT